jgi:hypothetical protein
MRQHQKQISVATTNFSHKEAQKAQNQRVPI